MNEGADIINISQGLAKGYRHTCNALDMMQLSMYNAPIVSAFDWIALNGYDVLIVFAAGNDYADAGCYPFATLASYYNNVIAVAACTIEKALWDYGFSDGSNYGSVVDVAAPGENIYTTMPSNRKGVRSTRAVAQIAKMPRIILETHSHFD